MRLPILCSIFFVSTSLMALPVDWHGKFGVDSTIISNYSKLSNTSQSVNPIPDGSQEVSISNDNTTASIQSYILKLSPTIIINDSATFFAEFTTGHGNGGRFGTGLTHDYSNNMDVPLQYLTTSNNIGLNASQFYAEFYSDTAIWQIGRYAADWGLGALINSGKNSWDRFTYVRDGINANLKFANFKFTPYWSLVNSGSFSRGDKISEQGIAISYDNSERDLSIGILYATRGSGDSVTSETGLDGGNLDTVDIKLLDLYFSKKFGALSLAMEIPLLTGNIGKAYSPTNSSNLNAKALIAEAGYKFANNWEIFGKFGTISGDDGQSGSFNALYLNPNYQIGKLIGRYNFMAFNDPTNYNAFDSSLTNMQYLALSSNYKRDKYTFKSSIIYAQANEVAQNGASAFNHLKGKVFTATTTQAKDMGIEIDLGVNYQWNREIRLDFDFAYHMVGDYYTFSNDSTNTLEAANSMLIGLGAILEF